MIWVTVRRVTRNVRASLRRMATVIFSFTLGAGVRSGNFQQCETSQRLAAKTIIAHETEVITLAAGRRRISN
jgi:hypothetical protein